jgi:hypothetical protein
MFSSTNPRIYSLNRLTSFFSFTASASSVTLTLPGFSTAISYSTRNNSCISICFIPTPHTSRPAPRRNSELQVKRLFRPALRSQFKSSPNVHVTRFPATLAGFPQLAENPATLSLFAATLTSHVSHNSFVCHSYKKYRGVGASASNKKRRSRRKSGTICAP